MYPTNPVGEASHGPTRSCVGLAWEAKDVTGGPIFERLPQPLFGWVSAPW
jgi:hypothetical protein